MSSLNDGGMAMGRELLGSDPCSLIDLFALHTDQHAVSMVDCGTEGEC